MFDSKKKNYDQLSLNDFSDDDTDDENDNTISDHKNTITNNNNKKTNNSNNTFPNRISNNNNNNIKNTNNFNSMSNNGSLSSESTNYSQNLNQQQQNNNLLLVQKQQDEGLEMLGYSAERLGKMSMLISDEINNQNKLLDEIDTSFDTASDNLQYVTSKTKQLIIDQAGGTKNFLIILSLVGIVLFLLLLILYT